MRLLCLDTSTPATTVALVDDGVVLGATCTARANAHGELLAPALQELLAEHGSSYDAVACGTGPGPYTSLRVGIASAVALGQARGVPTWGACSLDLVGYGTTGRVLVVQDARRREVFWAVYSDGLRVDGPHVGPAQALSGMAVDAVLGDPLAAQVLAPRPMLPRAEMLWHLTLARHGDSAEPLTPIYLREPDAVPPGERKRVS